MHGSVITYVHPYKFKPSVSHFNEFILKILVHLFVFLS